MQRSGEGHPRLSLKPGYFVSISAGSVIRTLGDNDHYGQQKGQSATKTPTQIGVRQKGRNTRLAKNPLGSQTCQGRHRSGAGPSSHGQNRSARHPQQLLTLMESPPMGASSVLQVRTGNCYHSGPMAQGSRKKSRGPSGHGK